MPKSRTASKAPPPAAPQWPADTVERRAVDTLIPYARNARKHSEAQVTEIAGSITQWGWTIPVLIDEGGRIIAGHGRVLAAHKLGIAEIPVMVAHGWSDAQKAAYTLADNQLALHGTWDTDLLKVELRDLQSQAVDLGVLGFAPAELDQLFAPATDPDTEWEGMPEFEQNAQKSYRALVVHFPDQASVDRFAALLNQPIPPKAPSIWFPHKPREDVADQRWISDAA
jgi:ParB-like chromosome segregation protein Spo0J